MVDGCQSDGWISGCRWQKWLLMVVIMMDGDHISLRDG